VGLKAERFRDNERLALAAENSPPLKSKETGQAVRLLQQALIDLGYKLPTSTKKYGSPDGIYGTETKGAVYNFQVKEKLESKDGVAGKQTLGRLDDLLKGKAYTPLPPIPGMDDSGDVLNATEKVVLDTLGSGTMTSMGFSLSMTQTVQQEGEAKEFRHQVYIRGESYQRIGEAVYNGEIGLELDPSIGPAALYDPATDTLKFSRKLKPTLADKAMVIHEATHAICDWKGVPMNALFAEIAGFVAEGLYALRVQGTAKTVGDAAADKVYKLAFEAAQKLKKGSVPQTAMDDLGLNIRSFEAYKDYTYGNHAYNGRSRTP
jgi:hypothetical protein